NLSDVNEIYTLTLHDALPIFAGTMARRGCRGAVVDGGVRDVEAISRELEDFPVFSRYRTPVQSIGRWRVTRHDVPIYMPGAWGGDRKSTRLNSSHVKISYAVF